MSVFPPVTEKEFQRMVARLATLRGWTLYHTHDSRRSQAGFPDLVLVRERVLFRELKTQRGRVRPEQTDWLERLQEAGADAKIWRPSDWPEIEQTLFGEVTP